MDPTVGLTQNSIVAICHHRAEQCILELGRHISPSQGSVILRSLLKAKLLGHLQELDEDHHAEMHQWYLEVPPVGCVHDAVAVALDRCRGATLFIFFFGGCQPLPPKYCNPLPILCQLSKYFHAGHGWFWVLFLSWKFNEVTYGCYNAQSVVDKLMLLSEVEISASRNTCWQVKHLCINLVQVMLTISV
jgi:hypothetical protein